MLTKWFVFSALIFIQHALFSQSIEPDLQNTALWKVVNRTAEPITENAKKGVRLSEAPNDGVMILKDFEFANGTIEIDIKGKNVLQQSFVGVAFHGQNNDAYDAIYFRPFNFANTDTSRRSRSVQYISMPNFPWEKLRQDSPGKYENKVNPVPGPDDWFHVKITVEGKQIRVFVDNAAKPSLEVEKLTDTKIGGFALWVGNNSGGGFANLKITPSSAAIAQTPQKVSYGNNPQAGHYVNVGDAKLYYEVYGKGRPFVLLHGGVYGYISEFESFIPKLAENYQVICIATRGHGKSEIGHSPFTYKQRAEDAYKVIRSITKDSVIVLGFSDGAYSGLKLAALYPDVVKKLISIGASDHPKSSSRKNLSYAPEALMKNDSSFFAGRLALMPEPQRWGESLSKLSKLYNEDYMSAETFGKIKCPVLVMSGDRDNYHSVEAVVKCARAISDSQLSIISGCPHVVFFCNFPAVWEAVGPFLR